MIRHRLAEVVRAVAHAIERLHAAKRVEDAAQDVLELLGRAACSERATFWTLDPERRQLQAIANWDAAGFCRFKHGGGQRTPTLSLGNAGHVWRSRKPLWGTSLVFATVPDQSVDVGLRGGVWFAVKSDTAVYGVIELLGCALEPMTADHLACVERLGVRLGHVLEELRYGRVRLH
jgi:GAF domain-containing protein